MKYCVGVKTVQSETFGNLPPWIGASVFKMATDSSCFLGDFRGIRVRVDG